MYSREEEDGLLARLPVIDRSWRRCRQSGLVRSRPASQEPLNAAELRRDRERNRHLLAFAAEEMESLRQTMERCGGIAILTSPEGVILDARGNAEFVGRARRVSLEPGASWDERHEGTNAVGTALIERRLVQVVGEQHYLEDNRFLYCTAMPIMGPNGELAGILDLSGDARQPPPHCAMLAQLAVARIEHAWASACEGHDLLIRFHPHSSWLGTPSEGVLAFRDELLIGASPAALRLLGLDASAIARLHWAELFAGRPAAGEGVLALLDQDRVIHGSARVTPAAAAASPDRVQLREGVVWDPATDASLSRAVRALNLRLPVLIQGETGTGKELFVRAMCARSEWAAAPFVPVNCAAIPEGLLESELFGYEEGAFTGARRRGAPGLIRRADGGVLFLDEIGDMPLGLQARLLRVLQDGEITPLGGGQAVRVDFRLIAATHQALPAAVAAGRFRADLYYRLRHLVIELPPLRERHNLRGVIDALLHSFGASARGIRLDESAYAGLLAHDWPGNLREMANLLHTLVALADEDAVLGAADLPGEFRSGDGLPARPGGLTEAAIQRTLVQHRGNVSAAARELGVHRSTLYRKLQGGHD